MLARMGKLERIWIKRAHGGTMDPVDEAELVTGSGLAGSADQGGRRQVTLLSVERWAEVEAKLGARIDPATRRANLLVSGLDLEESAAKVVRIGDCRLRILGETRPCSLMDQFHDGLQEALKSRWGGGAYAEVLDSGSISIGDTAAWSTV
jgi:MOSC domain-containing protein YiiM